MARIRQIKPDFYLDDDLALCSREARLMFPGLWMLADRDGRLEDRPARIKVQIFPYDQDISPKEVGVFLDELAAHCFIIRYQAGGKNLIQVKNFKKHQHCHPKEPESQFPAPSIPAPLANPEWQVTETPGQKAASPENNGQESGKPVASPENNGQELGFLQFQQVSVEPLPSPENNGQARKITGEPLSSPSAFTSTSTSTSGVRLLDNSNGGGSGLGVWGKGEKPESRTASRKASSSSSGFRPP